jgi:hypothetical protein
MLSQETGTTILEHDNFVEIHFINMAINHPESLNTHTGVCHTTGSCRFLSSIPKRRLHV